MAPPANERPTSALEGFGALLAPFPGRMEFAARLALVCALTTLVAEIYQTPEPALTAYVVFFVMKPDRAESVVTSLVMVLLITVIIGFVLVVGTQVIDYPLWRVATMVCLSFSLTFAASASKLKPIAGTVALITAYALDLLGRVPGGELATRGLLYAWLFVGIPAGVSIVVNMILGPAPRRLAEQAMAHRLHLAAIMLGSPHARARKFFQECLREGAGEIPKWLKLAAAEKTSSTQDIAALQQATRSTVVILSLVDFVVSRPELLSASFRKHIAHTLDSMATMFGGGGYPADLALEPNEDEAVLTPLAVAVVAELRAALSAFAVPPAPESTQQPAAEAASGFFLPDAFTNPAHVHYALKTTAAAMFCYVVYLLLDWPGIHTCLITCYTVSLGTTAETVEKQTLRILGCLVGAAAGIAAIVFLMPTVTSIGALMIVVFLAALASGWVAAGSPRISYVGLQLAFAFFLSVVQGSSPAFDMTIARDRVIGVLFGNLVVSVIFALIWPVSVAGRVDPAIAVLFRRLAAMASAKSKPMRWALAVEARTKLGAIEQDLELTRYEPSSIRPSEPWLNQRWQVTNTLSMLQGPLLIGADQEVPMSGEIARRFDRLSETFDAVSESSALTPGTAVVATQSGPTTSSASQALSDLVETYLVNLENRAPQLSEGDEEGRVDYAQT
jgi:multidrug resistance protein MdtO